MDDLCSSLNCLSLSLKARTSEGFLWACGRLGDSDFGCDNISIAFSGILTPTMSKNSDMAIVVLVRDNRRGGSYVMADVTVVDILAV